MKIRPWVRIGPLFEKWSGWRSVESIYDLNAFLRQRKPHNRKVREVWGTRPATLVGLWIYFRGCNNPCAGYCLRALQGDLWD
jgi:hypothetical protein